jgi:hypothetical protein
LTDAHKLLFVLGSTYIAAGAIAPHLRSLDRSPDSLLLAQAFVVSALLFRWCRVDAQERRVKHATPLLLALVPPVGLPYYFFRTRPVGKAFGSLGKSLLFYLATAIVYDVCFLLSARVP